MTIEEKVSKILTENGGRNKMPKIIIGIIVAIIIFWVTAILWLSTLVINTVSKTGLKPIIEKIWLGENNEEAL